MRQVLILCFAGSTVVVRSIEWSLKQSAAEWPASQAPGQCLWHSLLHPAAGLRSAACESQCDQILSVSALLLLSFQKIVSMIFFLRTRHSWCVSQCCWVWLTVKIIWWRLHLWELWESTYSSPVWGRWGQYDQGHYSDKRLTIKQDWHRLSHLSTGCDVCGRHGKRDPRRLQWRQHKRPGQGCLVFRKPGRCTYY